MTKNLWRGLFLGLTGLVIGMEVWAANDRNPTTAPWTEYILAAVDEEVFWGLFGGGVVWAGFHFGIRYMRKRKAKQSLMDEENL